MIKQQEQEFYPINYTGPTPPPRIDKNNDQVPRQLLAKSVASLLHGPVIKDIQFDNGSCSTFQFSIHRPPTSRFIREVMATFPALELGNSNELLIIPVFQRSKNDLIDTSRAVNAERDLLLDHFYRWASLLRDWHLQRGYWMDAGDPTSGLALFNTPSENGNSSPYSVNIWPDVVSCQKLLMYDSVQVGCCKVVIHPQWGSCNYPSTVFSKAPIDELVAFLESIDHVSK